MGKILLACEESQAVCKELRRLGHEAYSCDIQECSGDKPEWHIQGDVLEQLDNEWDMIIAFPPCTHLAVSGALHFKKKREDGRQREGIEFFMKVMNAKCDKICIENPVGIISGDYLPKHFPDLAEQYNLPVKPTQIIHPWMFGDEFQKATCLWLKGLPNLEPTKIVEKGEFKTWTCKKTGKQKRQPKWCFDSFADGKARSKTFMGIATAMAEQWGKLV